MKARTIVGAAGLLLVMSAVWTPDVAQAGPDPAAHGSGLQVERVVRTPTNGTAGNVQVYFRLVGVEALPRHPSVTYVLDPETGERVTLPRVAMLPATAADAATAPLARLDIPDERGVIRPGRIVTVVVAGLVQAGVRVEGPGQQMADRPPDDGAGEPVEPAATETVPKRVDTVPTDATLEVIKLRTSAGGYLLDLRYRVSGTGMVLADEHTTFIEIPETGEKLYVLGVARIGTLATKDAGPAKTSFLLIQNPNRKIKPGDRVHVIVAGIRAENVRVES